VVRQGKAWLGKARRDKTRHVVARDGKARLVKANLG
jgi:hypothetical protein